MTSQNKSRRGSAEEMTNFSGMKTLMGRTLVFILLLVAPAWACDMGSLFHAILFALAIGAAICSAISALLAWAMRPTSLPAPYSTLLTSIVSGTALGTGAGIVVGSAMGGWFQFLWVTLVVSIVVSSAIVSLAPSRLEGSRLMIDDPTQGLSDAATSFQEHTSEWKTLS